MTLIKKKDNKLQEINKILDDEVNPQLEALRKDKEDYALFKSNEGQIDENEKIIIAFDFWENEKYLKNSDHKANEIRDRKIRIEKDINFKN